jgi:FMN phosphatase YigB (HAD superfamily)
MEKKIVYVDMDNVLVDFKSGIMKIDQDLFAKYDDRLDEVPGIIREIM